MVDYFLFGEMDVRVGGVAIALGGPKQRGVLAVLLANHGNVVSTDEIIDSVWDDAVPAKAVASVRSYVANLRRLLTSTGDVAGPRLESRSTGYRINLLAEDSVDLHRFHALVTAGREALSRHDSGRAVGVLGEALALWRGEPFGEFAYRDFVAPDVQRLNALRTAAIQGRFDAALRLGGGGDLVPDLEAAVAAQPLQEPLWEFLVIALYRAGRPADAVGAFDRAAETLRRELGAEPGRGLLEAVGKVSAGATDVLPPVRADSGGGAVTTVPFVGRHRELRDVDARVQAAAGGHGGLTLITGDSGIGKTALAAQAVQRARRAETAVGWAAHPEDIRVPLLWTWIQILRQLGADLGEGARDVLRRNVPGVVDALVPEWHAAATGGVAPSVAATGFVLVEGIVSAVVALSVHRPLLLVLDDLQLADDASLSVLALLASRLPHLPVTVIGNWTFHGAERPVNPESFQRLLTTNDVVALPLAAIDRDAAEELIDAVTEAPREPEVAERIWRQAGGNPFFVKELARTVAVDGGDALPQTVLGVIGRRLAALDDRALQVMAAAAVIGPRFDVADLSEVLELPTTTVHRRLQEAYAAGLIDESRDRPGGYHFGHGLLREAISVRTSTAERADLHAAIATTRAIGVATAAYEDAVAAAGHAWHAGAGLNADTAIQIHEGVIERALGRSAYEDVASLAEQVLQIHLRLPPKPELLERQAMTWLHLAGATGILQGQGGTAASTAVQRALEIGAEVRGRSYYSAVAVQCLMLGAHGRIAEAEAIAVGLHRQYEASGDPDIGLAGAFTDVMVLTLRGETAAALAAGHRMLDTFAVPETVTDPLHFLHPRVCCWMALCAAITGDRAAMRSYAERAMELARGHGDVFNILAAKLVVIECAALLGDVDGTVQAAESLEREFAAAGGHQWGALATLIAIWARCAGAGDGDALAAFDAFETLTADGTCAMNSFYLGLLADIEASHGRADHGRELLTRAHELADTTGEHAWDGFLRSRLAATR